MTLVVPIDIVMENLIIAKVDWGLKTNMYLMAEFEYEGM